MLNWGAIFHILGWLMGGFGLAMLIPAGVALLYHETIWLSFIESSILTCFIGGNLMFLNKGAPKTLNHKDGFMLTTLTWLIMGLLGSMPLYFTGIVPSFIDAAFESFSGLTTTGATVLTGLDDMSKGILFWRALLQWLWGMGVVVLAIAILPFLGIGGMQIYKTEMAGVVKDKLQPRMQETAKLLWGVYLFITAMCATYYFMFGMGAFDAICHAFTTIATGGFANYDNSFGHYDTPVLEWGCIFFMLMGGANFALHYTALHRLSLKGYKKDQEFKLYVICLLAISVAVFISWGLTLGNFAEASFRESLFSVVSVATTTGYATLDYEHWSSFVCMTMIIVMCWGGCSGSTAGGLKMMRVMLIAKQGQRELTRLMHPRSIQAMKINGIPISEEVRQTVWSFVGLFFAVFAVLTMCLSFMGIPMIEAFSAVAATITSAGPGLGEVGPAGNYSHVPQTAKVLLCFSMVVGRLEMFTVLVVLSPGFWRR
ncbi:MAG: potassium transporter [Magnetococcales bacterium]|nr:potassium transporter [Magnetococcales bacterium]